MPRIRDNRKGSRQNERYRPYRCPAYRFNRSLKADDIKDCHGLRTQDIYAENRRILDSNFQFMSSAEQERVFNTFGDPAWALTTLLDKDPQNLSAEAYDAVVYRTGMQLRSQQETRRIINESKNPDIRLVADSIATLRALHKQINITPDQWLTPGGKQRLQRSLTARLQHRKTRDGVARSYLRREESA